ncbi:hypothetical protein [Foetidibacter luteolus]|uniref:hypothetical protein n=1 Tax=Foetidibacter luteolus TaxID=2608880 RepID=UPI00129BB041|nr:hypothetical protein [Foetidibacter luteolus]
MENRNEILNELATVAPALLSVDRTAVYAVPEGYFNNLADNIMRQLQETNPIIEGNLPHPFQVPDAYFDNLAEGIMQKIKFAKSGNNEVSNELEEVAPFLNSIGKANVYTVPQGYFDNFQVNLKPQPEIIKMQPRKKWYLYASAAAVVIVLLTGSIFWFGQNKGTLPGVAAIPSVDVQKEVAGIPEEEIISYLTRQPVAGESAYWSEEQEPDLNEYIKSTGTDEIQQFLEENPVPEEKSSQGI